MDFITFRFLDVLDIILVAFLLYQVYSLIKGSVAINIFAGLFTTYLFWLLVKALNMQLLSNILGQFMGVGIIALIIVFQQEIRRFLIMVGTRYFSNHTFSLENLFSFFISEPTKTVKIQQIVKACENMARNKTGSLIVITNKNKLDSYADTGEILFCDTSSRLIESIFYKNGPLHDGAMIIQDDKVFAAGCVLPISDNKDIPRHLGLRHRAALGISEVTDALVVVTSEETGSISYAKFGEIKTNLSSNDLFEMLKKEYEPENEQN